MKHIIKIYLSLILLVPNFISAQEQKTIKNGDKEYDKLAYIDARESYIKASNNGFQSTDLLKKLGDSYYFNADYSNAAKWYGQLYESSESLESEYIYRYALSLKSDERYEASDKVMEAFYKSKGEDTRASLFVNERNYLNEIELNSGRFELTNVDFNSELSDFAPAFYQGSIIYSSNRDNRGSAKRVHDWNEQPFLDLYKLTSTEESNSTSSKFSSKINSIYHESTAIFTKDGKTMYFTRNNYTKKDYKEDTDGTNRLKLYRATRVDQGSTSWDVEELPFNSDEYSVAHPALSPDEKTLYFASDMPGTKGFSDLYKVAINDSVFGTVTNLGDKINTEGRETFPFVSKDNKLYFASDGHVGLGGLDVFVSDLKNDKIGEIYNLGKPINSPKDDFTFIVNSTTGTGYFASNREGGVGYDDIYKFRSIEPLEATQECSQTVSGVVVDKNTKAIIPNAKVILTNLANELLDQQIAGDDGSFSFPLDCNTSYCIRASKVKYGFDEECFNTTAELELALEMNLELEPDKVIEEGTDIAPLLGINMIYFDLDKDFIRSDAEVELRKVIDFMNVYTDINIDVRSHTDSRNTDAYNADLSSRRASSTVDYLVNIGGISRARLTSQGYGESQLRNRCSDGVPCSESEHQLNRRSEFIVVK